MTKKFEVGKFASYSWGYGQTNVDFFQVIKRTEKSVWFVPVKSEKTYKGNMHGTAVPTHSAIWTYKEWDGTHKSNKFRKLVKNGFDETEVCAGRFGNIYPWRESPEFFSEWN